MRKRNSAAMIGRVRSKSKSCAFSNSSAREGRGVAARVVAMVVAMVRVLGGMEKENLGVRVVREGMGVGVDLGVGGEVIRVLEEAMIMLAIVDEECRVERTGCGGGGCVSVVD
ncbi:hypothetical protein HanXRQr2_Chr13g0588341 [Helianthus annuus]|uniref:Uncharacterized protein n=1 Tax=Helianthus annuus TaxID=4232 RepID=A0A9K3EGQ6_HELAN|nr:hypothetical protein HanXRQr2_Chr13g0588341 [Helianthus annuus]KAJ0481255.1 hypothetical protein HanIR_Chr13g0640581 [Helianthus annuus]